MPFLQCRFCMTLYDMDLKPKPIVIESKGPLGKVHICASCVKVATSMVRADLGPEWPKKKV